jgi:cytochrome c oxidase cbb3-type subunit III
MSDFISEFWSYYIAAIALVGIVWCVWLLFSQRKVTKTAGGTEDTGHVWDGDLRELNNPLPRWWMWMFLLACIFSLAYLVLYPGLGSYAGVLKSSTQGELAAHRAAQEKMQNEIYAKYLKMDVKQVAADPQAREIGQRLFLNYCAQCHGSDARGSRGFPNLTDNDWLYGGEPDIIQQTITKGRNGATPSRRATWRNTCARCRGCRRTRSVRRVARAPSRRPAWHATAPAARATRRSVRPTCRTTSGCMAARKAASSTPS